jgi:hypothetical protein
MYCGMPMEDDDMFCTRCGKATAESRERAGTGKGENPELMTDDATITGTMRTVTSETVPPAGMAAGAGAAYGAGRGPVPSAPKMGRPENAAYNRPAAGGAAYGPGPASSGNPKSDPRPRHESRHEPGRDSMYGNPHVDTAIEKSGRRGKTDPGRYIMLASAAVLVLVLGFLLFLLVKPVETDEKKDTDKVAYEGDNHKEGNLSQGQQAPVSEQAQPSDQSSDSGNKETASPAGADQTADSDKPADVSAAGSGSQNGDQSTQAPQNSDQSTQVPQNSDQSAQAPQNSGQSSQPQYEEPEEPEEDDYEDDDSDGSGWEIDEDGNEVYYAADGEENTDSDQTVIGGGAVKIESGSAATQSSDKKKTGSDKNASGKAADDIVLQVDSDYILPESSSRYYTRQELSQLDDYNLQMAINEIYARHGRKFDTQSIREYFEGKSWYRGTINPADFDGNESLYFNEYEMANRELMSQIRAERQGTTPR